MQIILVGWFLSTGRMTLPWEENKTVCDTVGNCIKAGIWLPLSSYALSWLSVSYSVVNIYQGKPSKLLVTILLFRVIVTLFDRSEHLGIPAIYGSF